LHDLNKAGIGDLHLLIYESRVADQYTTNLLIVAMGVSNPVALVSVPTNSVPNIDRNRLIDLTGKILAHYLLCWLPYDEIELSMSRITLSDLLSSSVDVQDTIGP